MYHSSETPGYRSVIMIQMTPKDMPPALALVHLRVSVEGIEFEKTFEADPELKYTYSWDRRNAYRQKVYGIVPARGKFTLCMLGNFSCFICGQLTFFKLIFSKNSFTNTIRVSNSFDPDQDRHFVCPDLGLNFAKVVVS